MATMTGSSKTEWPPALKSFASRAFSASNDMNRAAVQEELRAVIYRAFTEGTINTTDWDHMELEALGGKKQKKKRALSGMTDVLAADLDKKEKRARRFEQEKAAFNDLEQQHVVSGAEAMMLGGTSTSRLADRLGGAATSNIAHQQGWQYDFTGSTAGHRGIGGIRSIVGAKAWSGQQPSAAAVPFIGIDAAADPNVIDWDQDTVVGLSTKLEKSYLRLTSAPDPRNVRTLATLMQTLEFLKRKWRDEASYSYICDQFKSLRQDLTVQRIKNDFTVKVYEIHARIALEKGDLGEYNQCQSQLRGLYAVGLKGSVMEFLAYRILYLQYTRNRRDVNALMAELTPSHKTEPAVKHALAVRSALATGNYHSFFRLYDDAPNMNAYVMDHFIDRERINALLIMARCYRPSLALSFLTSELAFADVKTAHDFLSKHQAALYVPVSQQANVGQTAGLGKKAKRGAPPPALPALEARNWDAKAAQAPLDQARSKFRTVDIKGQV